VLPANAWACSSGGRRATCPASSYRGAKKSLRACHLLELAGGAWDLAVVAAEELSRVRAVVERYDDQSIGVADASNVVLAARKGTKAIVTLDRRHFEVLRPLDGGRFALLPSPRLTLTPAHPDPGSP
jgi:predicted nucleic acid-binding protein